MAQIINMADLENKDWDTSKLSVEFSTFVADRKVTGKNCEGKDAKYVPFSVLTEFWTEEKIDQIFQSSGEFLIAPDVRRNYIRVLSTLVFISQVANRNLLHYFHNIKSQQRDDSSLPWLEVPQQVFEGSHATRMFRLFFENQWMFCPAVLDQENRMSDRKLHSHHVLPFTTNTGIEIEHNGRDSTLSVVKISEEAHSHLKGKHNTPPQLAVVKTYQQKQREVYEDERRAYEALCDKHPNILRYLGSFQSDQTMSILLEYTEQGTLEDLFARNDTPCTYDEVRAFWKSFVDLVGGLETVHNTAAERGYSVSVSLQTRKDVLSPLTFLFSVHQDLKPSNIFVFRDTSPGASPFSYILKIGDFGNSHVTFANRSSRARDGPHRGGSRTYAPPELLRADSIHYQASSDVDIWAMGCMIVEAAVWVVFGERGRTKLRADRLLETQQLPDHRDLGHGDCFHDGQTVLQCVAQDIIKNISRDGRRSDTITSDMVDLMVHRALAEKDDRDRAGQLLTKMKRKVFTRTLEVVSLDSVPSPGPVETPSQPHLPLAPSPQQPLEEERLEPTTVSSSSGADIGTEISNPTASPHHLGKIPLMPIPDIPTPEEPSPSTDMKVFFPKVTISELVQWRQKLREGITEQLPGWDSAKDLLNGRDFLILVDNSKFMQREQAEVIKVVKALSYLLKQLDPDGIEVVCTSSPNTMKRLKTATDIEAFIAKAFRKGYDANCAIENALDVVLTKVRAKYLEQSNTPRLLRVPTLSTLRPPSFKAISIFVFTNGKWDHSETGTCGAEKPIRRLISEMISQHVARTRICFQFVRFGDSEIGRRRLKFLDNELSEEQNYDIVDCKSIQSSIWDILVGPLSDETDKTDDP